MLGLARLADKGPVSAALLAASLLFAGLLLPLLLPIAGLFTLVFIVLSAAVVTYVLLRRGEAAGMKTVGIATVLLLIVSFGLYRSAVQVPLIELMFWAPSVAAAIALLRTVSLNIAVLVIVVAGLLTVIVMNMLATETALWREQLAAALASASNSNNELVAPDQLEALTVNLAEMLLGAFGVSVMTIAFCSLFLARAWQAAAVNPGGFQKEFHALRLGRIAAFGCSALIGLAMLLGGPLWSAFAMVSIFAFFLQGLSVCHAVVRQRGLSQGWLVGIYVLMLLPHTLLLLAALGIADNIFRLRGGPAA